MIRRSDVNSRLPRFHEALNSVEATRQQGGFEGVPADDLDYLAMAEPVGLDENNHLVLPDNYKPYDMLPLLMLRPHERSMTVIHDTSKSEMQVVEYLMASAGVEAGLPSDLLHYPTEVHPDFMMSVAALAVGVSGNNSEYQYAVSMPRAIIVGDETKISGQNLGPILAHEADHWDFLLNHAPQLQRQVDFAYDKVQMSGVAEKRAYGGVSHQIEKNLGIYDATSINRFVEQHAQLEPADARILRTCAEADLNHRGLGASFSLAVLAASALYGHPEQPITLGELTAFQAMGVVQPT